MITRSAQASVATDMKSAKNPSEEGFGVYVHWPFCLSKCPYCDFNSHVADTIDHDRWRRGLINELETFANRVRARAPISIFFGGGTPSLMAPDTAADIIRTVRGIWPVDPGIEITLEANPTSVEAGRLRAFREAGVNRVSLGVQALNDDALRFLGRGHDSKEAIAAVETAHQIFDRVSFDLIYARPEQSLTDWKAELRKALALAGDHLSLYQLTIEPGTAFHSLHQRGAFTIPDDDTGGALYEATGEILDKAGLPAYEISNHAWLGAESRHNLVYWRSQEYLGVGPGAHGRLLGADGQAIATRTHRAPAVWLDRVERDGHALVEETPIDRNERLVEILMMGLRLVEGVPLSRIERESGLPFNQSLDQAVIVDLVEAGYMDLSQTTLRATRDGRQRLNAVLSALLDARL